MNRSSDPPRRRAWVPDAVALVVVCLVMLVGYYEIPFAGKTFSAAAGVAGVQGCGGNARPPFLVCGGRDPADPRVDLGASSWALEPWTRVTRRDLSDGEVPLWNPYQGLGMPLAANMQSGVFDPLLLAVNVHPTPLVQDLSLLAALLLVGIGAYAAARSMRLEAVAATVAGSVYGLSGWFFVNSNNHWFSAFVWLPLIVASIEWTLRSTRRLPIAALAIALAGAVLAGMPEPTFVIFVSAGLYMLVRLFVGPRGATSRASCVVRLAGGGAIGLALTAPLLLLFREYVPLSFNSHQALSGLAPQTRPGSLLLNWMMPEINAVRGFTHAYSWNWVGIGAVLLATVGITSAAARRRFPVWPLLAIAGLATVMIYGGGLVGWTRHIPLWSQVLWPTFGTPVIAFAVAALAATGVQTVVNREVDRRHLTFGLGLLASLVLLSLVTSSRTTELTENVHVIGGWPLAVAVAIAVLVITFSVHASWAGVVVAGLVVLEVVLLAPHGFYFPRADPYPSYGWINTVRAATATDFSRAFSADGLLYPDTAGVYGLSDPRMLDALYVDRYWRYLSTFVASGLDDRFTANGPFEGGPEIAGNPMFDLLGVRYVLVNRLSASEPPIGSGTQYRIVSEDGPVVVYENTDAAPRAFVVHDVRRVDDTDAAVRLLTRGHPRHAPTVASVDPMRTAVIEANPGSTPTLRACAESATSTAQIVSRSASTVKVTVDAGCAGLLVLSDQYYPGWSATVNGRDARIVPTDIALRGVFVPKGESTVEFRYRPTAFRAGIAIWVLGVIALLALLLWVPLARVDDRRKQRRAGEIGEHPGVAA